jgi:hypothetical protein
MIRSKRDCPNFRLRWKGPYEIIRRLSDLNYLIRVLWNEEVVVNVNKMKKYCMKIAQPPHRTRDILVW